MQRPDSRDQSGPEGVARFEERSQSDSEEKRKQDDGQLERGEKEARDAPVSGSTSPLSPT